MIAIVAPAASVPALTLQVKKEELLDSEHLAQASSKCMKRVRRASNSDD